MSISKKLFGVVLIFFFATSICFAAEPRNSDSKTMQLIRGGIELYKVGNTTGALDKLQSVAKIDPNNPHVYSALTQIYALSGQYQRASEAFENYKKFGGPPEVAHVYGLAAQSLLRQFNKSALPPKDWEPKKYWDDVEIEGGGSLLTQLTETHMKDPITILGKAYVGSPYTRTYLKITNRYRFKGSQERPFEYAPGFYIWDSAVILDNVDGYGVLIANETKIKHVEIVNGKPVERLGVVRNWGLDFSQN